MQQDLYGREPCIIPAGGGKMGVNMLVLVRCVTGRVDKEMLTNTAILYDI